MGVSKDIGVWIRRHRRLTFRTLPEDNSPVDSRDVLWASTFRPTLPTPHVELGPFRRWLSPRSKRNVLWQPEESVVPVVSKKIKDVVKRSSTVTPHTFFTMVKGLSWFKRDNWSTSDGRGEGSRRRNYTVTWSSGLVGQVFHSGLLRGESPCVR